MSIVKQSIKKSVIDTPTDRQTVHASQRETII